MVEKRFTYTRSSYCCPKCGAAIPETGAECGNCYESPELKMTNCVISESVAKPKPVAKPLPPLPPGKKSIIIGRQ